ncbi:imidazoleglycerol-phosphate dehydratase HisB [Ornithinibacillus xuwenensis]|uniref:Imidazoleglycerol-phosphate dehydratase n=1 Tax=Ornithinibacillus xuwenensis TaxID=3144668 RepID=A0ABU9XKG2_9BACI
MRNRTLTRTTNETTIDLSLELDGNGNAAIDTGVGFLDHMLTLFTKHGLFNLSVTCNGDLHVDQHHTVEDIGIVLGQAFASCVGTKEGINRYASVTTPMDESLSTVTVDISGRPYLIFHVDGLKEKVGDFDTELVAEFFQAFVNQAHINLHINLVYGHNSHHIIESIFKGFGRALDKATCKNPRIEGIPSTKGSL